MPGNTISGAHIDYLQRAQLPSREMLARASVTSAPSTLRRLWHVESIGVIEKRSNPITQELRPRLLSEDLLIGLYGPKIPLAFLVRGGPMGVAVHLGTWSSEEREKATPAALDQRQEILRSSLAGLYSAVQVSPAAVELPAFPLAGIVLGVPTVKRPDSTDGALALDRLIRGMSATDWACLVLADPVDESVTRDQRDSITEEMRLVNAAALAGQGPAPLLEHYMELLKVALQNASIGLTSGVWRTGVYLLGDSDSFYRLTSLWRGIFGGDESLPEPVQVWHMPAAATLARAWALPDTPGAKGPGSYRHRLQHQTFLTSQQLAAYVHLPQLETCGFAVNTVPHFDVVAPVASGKDTVTLGKVASRGQSTENPYAIHLQSLVKHGFVAGVTGSGKTNTVFHLLQQLAKAHVPFLVIEPAKTEYRGLLADPAVADQLQIFTVGKERISPFRLNPFEVLPGIAVSEHLDLLRSVFAASFGMWTPLPQVLEICLYRIYEDRGWNIISSANARLLDDSDRWAAFPTLSELAAKVEDVTRELGYEERIASDIRAALLTRINSLRAGGKGCMLDVQQSLPMGALLEHPTVIELEGMGDDDDKAFVMGLLFARLAEHRRSQARPGDGLRHVLIIEEAHRLLTNVAARREEEGNPRGKAVETFANLLAEIRAYGQGVIVADQVPIKLAPDVIKNTSLKIAHRLVAGDDRAVLSGAMAMNDAQAHALATLRTGEAAIFSEGDDAPVLVRVPIAKRAPEQPAPGDVQVAAHMAVSAVFSPRAALFRPLQSAVDVGVENGPIWEAARRVVESPAFQRSLTRLILSSTEDTEASERLWPQLVALVQAYRPPGVAEDDLLRCVVMHASEWYTRRRGAQAGWFYPATRELADRLRAMLLAEISEVASEERNAFQHYALKLHERRFDPFPACSRICREEPPRCLYRFAAADLLADERLMAAWRSALSAETRHTWEVCMNAGYALIDFSADGRPANKVEAAAAAGRRASLCFGQQALMREMGTSPHLAQANIDKLLVEAGLER